jgi:hypothetical protein
VSVTGPGKCGVPFTRVRGDIATEQELCRAARRPRRAALDDRSAASSTGSLLLDDALRADAANVVWRWACARSAASPAAGRGRNGWRVPRDTQRKIGLAIACAIEPRAPPARTTQAAMEKGAYYDDDEVALEQLERQFQEVRRRA